MNLSLAGGTIMESDGILSTEEKGELAHWPAYAPDERSAIDAVLASGKVNYWTGQESRQFEREYADFLGVSRALALMNGTVALELPLRMWGIGPGDDVVVTPRSFVASVSCAVLLGARPIFADVDRNSGNITADTIEAVITPQTKAIIPVHLAGWPCEMDAIMSLARGRGIKVLEDCAQAHGARYKDRQLGSLGDAAAFSFCQDKIISTGGEGGLLATNDESLWEKSWSFKDHGKTWNSVYEREHGPGFRWVHDRFGTNFRMTELQGAIGRRQLAKLPDWTSLRRRNATILRDRLSALPLLRIPVPPAHMLHAYYKFYAYIRPERLAAGWTRDRIVAAIAKLGVPCFAGSCSEIYLEKSFSNTAWAPAKPLPVARELGESSIMFLVHPTISEATMHKACDLATDVLLSAGG